MNDILKFCLYLITYGLAIVRGSLVCSFNLPAVPQKGANIVFNQAVFKSGFEYYKMGARPWLVCVGRGQMTTAVFIDATINMDEYTV